MSIDRLNSAAWAAGFAMAPTEDEAVEAPAGTADETMHLPVEQRRTSRWQSAKVPADALAGGMRQWLTGWQRKATA